MKGTKETVPWRHNMADTHMNSQTAAAHTGTTLLKNQATLLSHASRSIFNKKEK